MTTANHFFTSITSNYIPKARVLASSIKQQDPAARFHLVLCDEPPENFGTDAEPFDSVIVIEELPIPKLPAWIFKHTVVEMCTAVKGPAFLEIARRFDAEKIFYFDPDMVVFSGLDRLARLLDQHSILLTPHQTVPEESFEAVVDNEICSLKHGVFNLGFLGVRTSSEGMRFLNWWAARLLEFCYDDIAGGLFTDQRWVDLAPGFFDDIAIMREPIYNVATWNLTHRTAAGSLQAGITINGEPLSFYHFSGFDGGAQEVMLKKYGQYSPVLFDLRKWYIAECERRGQQALGKRPCKFGVYDNGEPILKEQRWFYRAREDLQIAFPNPFATADTQHSYYHWYQDNMAKSMPGDGESEPESVLRAKLMEVYRELELIKRSRSWRFTRVLAKAWHAFR